MRGTHLVGSLPAPGPAEAVAQALATVGGGLRSLPDGETGERYHWIIHIIEGLRAHPDLELAKDGDWSAYDNIPVFRIKRGHTLSGESLDFGHVREFERSFPLFLEQRGDRDLAFQVGIP